MPKDNPAVCHVARVYGFLPGSTYRDSWFVVFDTCGNVVYGEPGQTAEAPSISYVELYGVPSRWIRYKETFTPGEVAATIRRVTGAEPVERPRRAAFTPFRERYVPIRRNLLGKKVGAT